MVSSFDERDTIALLQQRDPAALVHLDSYTPLMLRALSRHQFSMYLSREVREDIVKDAILSAFEKGPTFNPALAKLSTWLNALLHYCALDYLRREKHTSSADIDKLSNVLEHKIEIALPIEFDQTSQTMLSLINQLPKMRARVVLMSYYQELPDTNIAELLGISEVTVRSHLSRARHDLRQLVKDAEVDYEALLYAEESYVSVEVLANTIKDETASNEEKTYNPVLTVDPATTSVAETASSMQPRTYSQRALNDKEIQMLQLTADYFDTSEIAKMLCLSQETIEEYWQRIKKKLRARTKPHSLAIALHRGIIH